MTVSETSLLVAAFTSWDLLLWLGSQVQFLELGNIIG